MLNAKGTKELLNIIDYETRIINASTELKNEPSAHKRTMSSVEITEMTGKRHSDVMRSIRAMEPAWVKIAERKFASCSYKDENNRERPMYLLDYRECMYIATKFNDEARAKLILRWDELEREDREKERNAQRVPADSGASHTVHELIEWVGALQRLGGADKAATLELMKKIAEEQGLPMIDIPVPTENTNQSIKRPSIEKITPTPAKEEDKCKIVRKAYTLTALLKIHGKSTRQHNSTGSDRKRLHGDSIQERGSIQSDSLKRTEVRSE